MQYEHVTVSTFLETFGLEKATAMRKHFEAVTIDQQERLLAGTDSIGGPLATVEQFIAANRSKFVLNYPGTAA
jgi:NAD(P)H dehydrogenase (quinone)